MYVFVVRFLDEEPVFVQSVPPSPLGHRGGWICDGFLGILTSPGAFARYGIPSFTRSVSSPPLVEMNLASVVLSAPCPLKRCQRIRPDVP